MRELSLPRFRLVLLAVLFMVVIGAPLCFGQSVRGNIASVRTDSPRQTFESFLNLTQELEANLLAYRQNQTWKLRDRISKLGDEFVSLIDLSSVAEASRRKRGIEVASFLLDIFGRIEPPPPDQIPIADKFDTNTAKPAKWRVPNTPIEIVRIRQGPREGEFLFSGRTVEQAPRFYQEIENLKLRTPLQIKSWSQFLPQLTGPAIPAGVVSIMPDFLKRSWLDTPAWKILGVATLCIVAILILLILNHFLPARQDDESIFGMIGRLLMPILIILTMIFLSSFAENEINIAGTFAAIFASLILAVKFIAAAWIFWLLALIVVEIVVRSPKIPDQSLDASLLRLCARIVGIVGGTIILAYAANLLGVPVLSLIAGLGIGGLAVALAVRPTLENLIGGLILYADRPVRVGDFCSFGNYVGIIENIGVRSTQIRGRDRTLISIPNAKFADMEIINWAHCDKMLIKTTIGLRYETKPDQLRYVLANLREMFYSHPMIDTETVRVRFAGFGASSLDISIRVYALTREWNEFYAIQEDAFLRVSDVVLASGTDFAFPSQTLYICRDEGIDEERSNAVMDQVHKWRKSGKLPFPQMAQSRIDELTDSLDYPPKGSPDSVPREVQETDSSERLSAEDSDEAEGEINKKS